MPLPGHTELLHLSGTRALQEKEEFNCLYWFPKGCTVRNGFLEWHEEKVRERRRRASSCPRSWPRIAALQPKVAGKSRFRGQAPAQICTEDCAESSETEPTACGSRDGSHRSSDADELPTAANGSACGYAGAGGFVQQMTSPVDPSMPPSHQDAARWSAWTPQPDPAAAPWSPQPPMPATTTCAGRSWKSPQKGSMIAGDQIAIVLRGLPFGATEADVLAFLGQMGVPETALAQTDKVITMLTNQQGRPSGFAEIQLSSQAVFWEVQEKLHLQRLGGRYIEALPPRNCKSVWAAPSSAKHSGGGGGGGGGGRRSSWRRPTL